jgi:fucose 4-O-acetylase-like acetyltransferase
MTQSSENDILRGRAATRGILIVLIVIGHNKLFHANFYPLYVALYSFHVAAFLIMPFLYSPKEFTFHNIVNLFVRYMIPFYATVLTYSIIYFIVEVPKDYQNIFGWFGHLAGALSLANAYHIKEATGFEMLWFLPAFAALTYMYMAVAFCNTTFRILLILLSFLGHCLVGLLPEEAIKWVPFSAYVSIYVLAPALLFSVLRRFDRFGWQQIMIAGLVFCIACYLQREQRLTVVLSEFTVFSLTNVYALLVTDIQMLTGTFVCVALGQKAASSQILTRLGNLSMKIYLTHGLIGYIVYRSYVELGANVPPSVAIFATASITLSISYAVSLTVEKTRLNRWIFPRGLEDFRFFRRSAPA